MSDISDITKKYLKSNTFEPHELGNQMKYGLNTFGCESIIKYNDDIWKFIWFENNDAIYINKYGTRLVLDKYITGEITRMQAI
jgi:hypothetical protein